MKREEAVETPAASWECQRGEGNTKPASEVHYEALAISGWGAVAKFEKIATEHMDRAHATNKKGTSPLRKPRANERKGFVPRSTLTLKLPVSLSSGYGDGFASASYR